MLDQTIIFCVGPILLHYAILCALAFTYNYEIGAKIQKTI